MQKFHELLQRGGVWFSIPPTNPELFIKESIHAFRLPSGIKEQVLLAQTLEREALVSTAMGKGIALPHPKTLLAQKIEDSFIALAYPRFPVQWKSPDGQGVRAAFFVVSANQQEHLAALSSIAKLCVDPGFLELLYGEAGLTELLEMIRTDYPD